MPAEVVMPRLGWDMKVGSVAEWLKHDGDRVEVGEAICTIAGDKATTELEALDEGILRIPPQSPEPGEEVPVGTLLAYLLAPGEDVAAEKPPLPLGAHGTPPRGRGLITPDGSRRIVASPRARRAAAALGVDWRALVGTGRGGRVLERDVQHASEQAEPVEQAVRMQGVRRLTAERMALSARTVAPVTLTTEADATTLVRLREQARAERGTSGDDVPGYNDFMVKLVALALAEHPALNAELTDDGIVQHARVNIGIAVDTPRGLFVPVLSDARNRSVEAIASESRRLIGAAREGTIRPEELEGATFTITNLGIFEIDAFTPIVNLPQCAILGIGRIVARPVVVDEASEQVAVRRMLSLSLTFDHRLVDGAPAARFLQRIKHFVERPTLWLFR
jgi:pyruvate dehydrogenase E2 component (dihydrolipoamide acetyltransferase)